MKVLESRQNAKNPATAAILSGIFIGLGQAYNGEIAKAVLFVILYGVSIFLTFFLVGFVTTLILWVWSMVDAYKSSQKVNLLIAAKESPSDTPSSGYVMNFPVRG